MNADIPYTPVWVRRSFVSNGVGLEEGMAFAISSFHNRAIGFHVMLKTGAHYRHLPIHALATKPDAPERPLSDLEMWDCFSYRPVVSTFHFLQGHQCVCHLPFEKAPGTYLFTIDWLPDPSPGWILTPEQNKCAHVIALQEGNLAALPTNRITWQDGYWLGFSGRPRQAGYTVQTSTYRAEGRWDVSQDDNAFYRPQEGLISPAGKCPPGATPSPGMAGERQPGPLGQ